MKDELRKQLAHLSEKEDEELSKLFNFKKKFFNMKNEVVKIKDFIITPEIWEELRQITSMQEICKYIIKNNLNLNYFYLHDYCVLNKILSYSELLEYTKNIKRYSKEDVQLLISTLANNPYNLHESFRALSHILKKTPYNIKLYYYSEIKAKLAKNISELALQNTNKIFFIKGDINKLPNCKNITNQSTKVLANNFVLTPFNIMLDDKVIINNDNAKPYTIIGINRTFNDLITITLKADYGRRLKKEVIYYNDTLKWHQMRCGKNKSITLTQHSNE